MRLPIEERYRDFDIVDSTNGANWFYTHKDFVAEECLERWGCCETLEECKQEIDDWYKGEENE